MSRFYAFAEAIREAAVDQEQKGVLGFRKSQVYAVYSSFSSQSIERQQNVEQMYIFYVYAVHSPPDNSIFPGVQSELLIRYIPPYNAPHSPANIPTQRKMVVEFSKLYTRLLQDYRHDKTRSLTARKMRRGWVGRYGYFIRSPPNSTAFGRHTVLVRDNNKRIVGVTTTIDIKAVFTTIQFQPKWPQFYPLARCSPV